MRPAAIVLAAGGARRFGGDTHKLLASARGRRLIEWALLGPLGAAERGAVTDVIVVGGAVDLTDVVPPGVLLVPNPVWAAGMATSLRAGLDVARRRGASAVVVGLGDQPGVGTDAWCAVAAADAPIAVARYPEGRRPPVRLSASTWPLLPSTGDEGARAVMTAHPELVVEVPVVGDPDDIDTQEDLARWS